MPSDKDPNEMKIFITGGAGYVGCVLTPYLLNKGYEVVVYDLFLYGDNLKDHPKLTKVKGDIRDRNLLCEAMIGSDVMIHLACISNDPSYELNPELGKSINYDAFKGIVKYTNKSSIKRLIYASSSSVYGISDLEKVTEDIECKPLTDYSKYKLMCEELLLKNFEKEKVIVRPATLCGYSPRLRLDLVVNMLTAQSIANRKITVFGGSQYRANLNVVDMVLAYGALVEADGDKIDNKIYNTSDRNLQVRDVAQEIRDYIDNGTKIEYIKSIDNRSYRVNSDKIRDEIGFKPRYSFKDALYSLDTSYELGLYKDINNSMYHNVKRMKEVDLS